MSAHNGFCVQVVRRELLEALAAQAAVSASSKADDDPFRAAKNGATNNGHHSHSASGNYTSRLMVDRWLQERGVSFRVKPQPDGKGRTVYVLKHCPFDPGHSDPDSCIMQAPDGKLSAQCFHNSCSGQGWQAFKEAIGKPEAHHYDPPLQTSRRRKTKSEGGSESTSPAPSYGGYPLTDLGNAERLRERHGADLRHCHPWKKWYRWNGRLWAQDKTGAIITAAVDTVRSIYAEASDAEDPNMRAALCEHAEASEDAKAIRAMIDLARAQPGIPILPTDMDLDPWLFNCRNGTLDLRTGQLREHRRADVLTKICPIEYHRDAPCPAWSSFLDAVFPNDEDEPDIELIVFMQRLLGRCLTGDVSEQNLPIFWGSGANGKSTLVNAVLETLGPDYSMKANADLLMSSNRERHPTELASLFGMRFVVASETHQGRHLNEVLVKDLTGGEPIRARRMREDFWEFLPTHKVVLLTNHKPRVAGRDEGIWRRLRLIPYTVCYWDPADPGKDPSQLPSNLRQDKQLGTKLRAEREGILAWLVRGCLEWQRDGLTLPEKVKAETKKYKEEEDVLASWIEEACVIGDTDYRQRSQQLFDNYKNWCERAGEQYLSQKIFGPTLEDRGYKKHVSDGVWYLGIALRK